MPDRTPQFGETWYNPTANIMGIVADVSASRVTFVSYTGTWLTVPAPSGLQNWKFKKPALDPAAFQRCSREGCGNAGFFVYRRNTRQASEIACPRHIPRGVRSEEIGASIPHVSLVGQVCQSCKQDANEILGALPRFFPSAIKLWCCHFCGDWWLHGLVPDKDPMVVEENQFALAMARTFTIKGVTKTRDPFRSMTEFHIAVKAKHGLSLQGEGPLSIYDLILNES